MIIGLAHNYYGSAAPSGENNVYESELTLLRQKSHTVIEFTRHSDEIRRRGVLGAVRGALSTPWNIFSRIKAEKLIKKVAPDILHMHNSFPLLSPAVFYAAKKSPTATVLTLHNYRIFCAAGILMHHGKPCTECLENRSVRPALRYRCYRESLAATIPMAAMIWLHRRLKTWERQVDAFVALTEFQKDLLCEAGLPRDRVFVKPHFYPNPPEPLPWAEREGKVLFVGRLGAEKGCHILLEAWQRWGAEAPHLEVIGDGPERLKLEATVANTSLGGKVSFRGQLAFKDVQISLRRARLLVLPSLCFEGFPMVIREAYALGVPVAASRLGSMPCLIEEGVTGTLFETGNPDDLLEKVKKAWEKPRELETWGEAARSDFNKNFTADANHQTIMQIYAKAIQYKKSKLRR